MRPARAVLVLGLVTGLGTPAAWAATRPPVDAGPPVAEVLASSGPGVGTPAASSPVPAVGAGWVPEVDVRSAAPPAMVDEPVPARVVLAEAGIDAPVDPVGLTVDGAMRLPADVRRVGWYRHGPAPGEAAGSAVLAGHVDSRTQGLGEMSALREAQPGDEVRVTDTTGAVTRWRVVSTETLSKQELPLDQLFARSGPPRLVLLTCGGPFLPDLRSYRDNVVVLAEPAP